MRGLVFFPVLGCCELWPSLVLFPAIWPMDSSSSSKKKTQVQIQWQMCNSSIFDQSFVGRDLPFDLPNYFDG
jgi:hypothetical protein